MKLEFSSPVLLAGPAQADFDILRSFSEYPLIAADGGANGLFKNAMVPAAIIGDFDSLDKTRNIDETVKMFRLSEQDSSDFEKCLYTIDAPLFLAFGFIAKRFDHTLASVSTMLKYFPRKKVILVGEEDISFVVKGAFSCEGKIGQNISIFPLIPITYTSSQGLEYPLDKLELKLGGQTGTSNRMNSEFIEIMPTNAHLGTPYLITLPISRLKGMVSEY